MKRTNALAASFSALLSAGPIYPYDVLTHRDLSVAAIESSLLRRDPTVLTNLGLAPLSEEQRFSINGFDRKTIVQHVSDGSRFEDDGLRPAYHFFDPLNDNGLLGNHRSPDWALEDKQEIETQNASFGADEIGRLS